VAEGAKGLTDDILTDALRYAERGLLVCPCGSDKRPIGGWKTATDDTSQISELWAKYPDANVGIATGERAGVLVLDVDEKRGGDVDDLERRYGQLPETPIVRTGAGEHHYFAHPGGELHGSDDKLAQGVEIKAHNQGVIAPPSIHPSGRRYAWEIDFDEAAFALPPDWLLDAGVTERTERDREDRGSLSVLSALSVTGVKSIEHAIALTLPAAEGERNRRLFDFARALAAIPSLADAKAKDLKPYVRQWHDAALPTIGTKAFEDTLTDFEYAWPRVQYPLGTGPMTQMLAQADASDLPQCAEDYDAEATIRLIKLCRELQRAAGDDPFFLSCRTASELLNIDRMTAWRRLKRLVGDDVLDLVEKGQKLRASRYRYLGE
jgi:hypothetical protein